MFIDQFNTPKFKFFLYLPFPLLFFGLMIINFLAIKLLNLDVNQIIQDEINRNGVNSFFIDSMVPFLVGLILLFLWVKYIQKETLVRFTTSRSKIDWKRFFFAFSIWGTFQIVITLISYFLSPEDYVLNFDLSKFIVFFALAVVLIPFQTSFEEYLFRGHLMQGLGVVTKNRWFPLLFTSIAFGLMHISNPEIDKLGYIVLVYYIGTGFFLGIITLMDEGLELALGFHLANNLVMALLVTANWTAFQTHSVFKDISEPSAGFEVVMPVLIIFPLLLFVFAKKYGWNNWKEKLTGKVTSSNNIEAIEYSGND
ncbi:CPBP family intramembrane glutamic endopeptidase [Flavobacterium sp. GCM10027622]|uniref:CPBP family intramembrane glutamic endopeptidase n=1 Tax=unclassified Flavobacterium TaxID=196869 RepID=UPI00360E08D1